MFGNVHSGLAVFGMAFAGLWIGRDAIRRGVPLGWLWSVLFFASNGLAGLLYLAIRGRYPRRANA